MSSEEWAALGCCRGHGESLGSWLRAGPLGAQGLSGLASSPPANGDLYCPACHLDEAGRRRWYTREDWSRQSVVCATHALPLLRCEAPPATLRSRRWPVALREEFRALASWTQQGGGGEIGRAITRAVSARSDPRVAYSRAWAEAQWQLWARGWPVPAAPRPVDRGGVLAPWHQVDRLALLAITYRVSLARETGQSPGWRTLPIRARVLRWLQGRAGPMADCFRAMDGAKADS